MKRIYVWSVYDTKSVLRVRFGLNGINALNSVHVFGILILVEISVKNSVFIFFIRAYLRDIFRNCIFRTTFTSAFRKTSIEDVFEEHLWVWTRIVSLWNVVWSFPTSTHRQFNERRVVKIASVCRPTLVKIRK